jgi:hypothetical protein
MNNTLSFISKDTLRDPTLRNIFLHQAFDISISSLAASLLVDQKGTITLKFSPVGELTGISSLNNHPCCFLMHGSFLSREMGVFATCNTTKQFVIVPLIKHLLEGC